MKPPKLIYIEWCDAITRSDGWLNYEEAIEWCELDNWITKQAGYLLKETKEYILLASQKQEGNQFSVDMYSTITKIPKTWIIKRISLDENITSTVIVNKP